MSIFSKITDLINGPYRYRAGPNTLGIGIENLALVVPGLPVQAGPYSPSRDVRRSMQIGFATVANPNQPSVPIYDLRQNGLFLTGAWELSGLVDMSGN